MASTIVEIEVSEDVNALHSFASMELCDDLLQGLSNHECNKPSVIQQRIIAPMVEGRDLVVIAPSGTGKRVAVSIAILQTVDPTLPETQVLVLSATEILADQFLKCVLSLGAMMKVQCHALGRVSFEDDVQSLNSGKHVVFSTPDRVIDLIYKGVLHTGFLRLLVLDGMDQLINKGHMDSVSSVHRFVPLRTQTVLLTTAAPGKVDELSSKLTCNPISVVAKRAKLSLEGMKQIFVAIPTEEWKLKKLNDFDMMMDFSQVLIFCNSRKKVEWLSRKLRITKYLVCSLHANMTSKERKVVINKFSSGQSKILITTDLKMGSLQTQEILTVVSYDFPSSPEQFIRRIARSGDEEVAIHFVKREEIATLKVIREHYHFGSVKLL